MFEYIKGQVMDLFIDRIIIEVGGIGYRIHSTMNSTASLKSGDITTIYTHFVFKEDEMSLYGFVNKEELLMFQQLISVSKVGPKLAVSILSTYTPYKLANYILSNDINSISKASGVGKKTAERIIVELRDKVKNYNLEPDNNVHIQDYENSYEALDALVALGYNKQEAEGVLFSMETTNLTTEETIKKALKLLMR
ncbi:Holliday junction DNA helicase subunit RuvA [Anaerovirgula multivorans]|uniref:Holliday junction branch migration complex subunit RuvA n=1 Tax=Anaerovirgula multivorans TaxID=312168 RepID=A0A239DNT4_9FIRM|nr:Holliday junction branch migration protein RuvA [Anaerovirgula multivorans]SNS34140.1 Holliday junction DNA helicase subunit RuvA [Anaerovirgula multivorans]